MYGEKKSGMPEIPLFIHCRKPINHNSEDSVIVAVQSMLGGIMIRFIRRVFVAFLILFSVEGNDLEAADVSMTVLRNIRRSEVDSIPPARIRSTLQKLSKKLNS
jgi:hypothetical protein